MSPHLVEQVEKSIVHNGVEVLHTAAVEGVHDPVLPRYGAELGLHLLAVLQLKDVLGLPWGLAGRQGRKGGVRPLQEACELLIGRTRLC